MSWFADLAGKAENLLINLDEQTGAALRNQTNVKQKRNDRSDSNFHSEAQFLQKKRPIPRNLRSTFTGKKPPLTNQQNSPREATVPLVPSPKRRLPSSLKASPVRYNLHNCPKTLVADQDASEPMEMYGYKARRHSLPTEYDKSWHHKLDKMETENTMLKNEINVMNKENNELQNRLLLNEEGEGKVVRSGEDITKMNNHIEKTLHENLKYNFERDDLQSQVDQLRSQLANVTNTELNKHREQKRELQTEISVLRERNRDLEELVKLVNAQSKEKDAVQNKTETDLRHAQSTINVLQTEAEKAREECRRLEREWEAYKLRVKSMLSAKDKEINTLQQGVNLTEDTKILVDQIESLKEERAILSEAVDRVRGESEDMRHCMESLESRHHAAERVVVALRDALKDERAARNRAEASCNNLAKELKALQIETSNVIANLRDSLQERDHELSSFRESSTCSSVATTADSSAINVADYSANIHEDTVTQLTQKLVERQSKIDMLMADNNMLKIQLDKLEVKYKSELNNKHGKGHSVVSFQDGGHRSRSVHSRSLLAKAATWFSALSRQHPFFRVFIVIYMVCLHFWVLTVLLTSSPEDYNAKTFNFRPQT